MTEAEQLAEKLMSGDVSSNGTTTDKTKGRKKAAKDWVQHYMSVTKFINGLDTKPSSVEELETMLIESWESKADERNDEFASMMGAA